MVNSSSSETDSLHPTIRFVSVYVNTFVEMILKCDVERFVGGGVAS